LARHRRAPSKSGPAKAANVLRHEEVAAVLSAFPEPSLEQPWRWVAGTCILTGARPGEAMGARKEDINTDDWTWNICRSWDNDRPKDGEPRTVVIVPELRPLLEAAMTASTSERIFCRPDGTPYDPSVRHGLVDHLRRALKRAGVVTGYRHKCRRKGCAFVETRQAAAESRCPKCNMRLWVTPIPRPLRFYDLRHTHATLLRKAGVDLGAVQKNMGHSSPEMTSSIYDQSVASDFRIEMDGALTFGIGRPIHAGAMQSSGAPNGEAPGAVAFANNSEGFKSGRQDLNEVVEGHSTH
jgi:integrase